MSRDLQKDRDLHRIDWGTVRKLAGYARPYRWLLLLLAAVMVVFAFLDAAMPLLIRTGIDRFAVPQQSEGLGAFAALCATFAVGRGVAVWAMIATGGRIHTRISCDLRRDGFSHLHSLSFAYFDRHAVGWLMSRLMSDAQELARFFAWGVVDIVDGFARVAIMTVFMVFLDLKLSLVILAAVPPMLAIIIRFQMLTLRRYRAVRQAGSELTAAVNEGIMGAPTTKALGREDAHLDEFRVLTAGARDAGIRAARASALYFPFVLLVAAAAGAGALWVGGEGVMDDRLTHGTLVAFLAYASSFFEPIKDLARRFPQFQNAQAAAERLFSLLEAEPDVKDTDAALEAWGEGPEHRFEGRVEFDHVHFHYTPEETVLQDFCLEVKPGETVALVGDTGAGKTTIVNLVCRFYEATAGTIRVDGVDITQIPVRWLRRRLAVVQQTPHLFSGSIRDNIRYGRLDASDADVEQAARLARVDDVVAALPDGYDFRVGEGGDGLSIGQKQLVSLARVLLADPQLLVLDEATSSVDTESEARIQDALEAVLEGRTSFVIAHRLSTVRHADRILYIRDGRVTEQGTHRELIRQRGDYCRLYSSQFIDEGEARVLR